MPIAVAHNGVDNQHANKLIHITQGIQRVGQNGLPDQSCILLAWFLVLLLRQLPQNLAKILLVQSNNSGALFDLRHLFVRGELSVKALSHINGVFSKNIDRGIRRSKPGALCEDEAKVLVFAQLFEPPVGSLHDMSGSCSLHGDGVRDTAASLFCIKAHFRLCSCKRKLRLFLKLGNPTGALSHRFVQAFTRDGYVMAIGFRRVFTVAQDYRSNTLGAQCFQNFKVGGTFHFKSTCNCGQSSSLGKQVAKEGTSGPGWECTDGKGQCHRQGTLGEGIQELRAIGKLLLLAGHGLEGTYKVAGAIDLAKNVQFQNQPRSLRSIVSPTMLATRRAFSS